MLLTDRIEADPATCSGAPRIAGTRIRVAHVLEWLRSGMSEAEILEDYPQLSAEDIAAARAYAPRLGLDNGAADHAAAG